MIRRPPRSTRKESSAASDVYKRQSFAVAACAILSPYWCRMPRCSRTAWLVSCFCASCRAPWKELTTRSSVAVCQSACGRCLETLQSHVEHGSREIGSGSWGGAHLQVGEVRLHGVLEVVGVLALSHELEGDEEVHDVLVQPVYLILNATRSLSRKR